MVEEAGGLQGLQTMIKSPGTLRYWNQGKNSYLFLDGELRLRVVKGFIHGCPVGQGQQGGPAQASGLQAGVPCPGAQVRGRDGITSVNFTLLGNPWGWREWPSSAVKGSLSFGHTLLSCPLPAWWLASLVGLFCLLWCSGSPRTELRPRKSAAAVR